MNTWVVGCHDRMDHISSALIRQNLSSSDSTLHILGSVMNACICQHMLNVLKDSQKLQYSPIPLIPLCYDYHSEVNCVFHLQQMF